MQRCAIVLFVVGLLFVPVHGGQPGQAEARLLQDLQFLTSEQCEGRGITTKGIHLAAEYIEREFIKAGLKGGGPSRSYYQPFSLTTGAKLGPNNRLVLKGPLGQTITLEHAKHFTTLPQGSSGLAETSLVFAGYGMTQAEPAYDDYAGLDVAGKVVVVLTETPRRGHRYADVFATAAESGRTSFALRSKVEEARRRKAAGVLVVNSRSRGQDLLSRTPVSFGDWAPWGLPVAQVRRELVDTMLVSASGETLAQVEQQIDAELKPRSRPLTGWTVRLETDVTHTQLAVKNVVGVLEGSGPLANETVVIGAHYDHVGYYGSTRRFPGTPMGVSGPGGIGGVGLPLALVGEEAIHHGADDNASGTSVVLELARRFAAQKDRQGRRLVFVAFTAEESGLLGSQYYCRNPSFPLENTVVMINMDQIGRMQDNKVMVGGLGSAKAFPPLIDRLEKKYGMAFSRDPSGLGPTDHSSFYAKRVPVLWFFTGFHEQYHRPTDRVETLNVPGLARLASLIGDIVEEVSTTPTRPEYAKTPGFDRTKTLWSEAPSTGIVPDYRDQRGGVLVADVFKNTAAAKAGIQKGDRLLALAGKKLADPMAFLTLARTLKPGDKIDVLVDRGGNEHTLAMALYRGTGGFTDPLLGVTVNLTDLRDGLVLADVPADSAAGKAGLRKGDRIVSIAGEQIRDRDGYLAILRTLQAGETVAVVAVRGEQTLQLQLPVTRPLKKGFTR